ncbi:MAG TPA: hypothetical protein VLQ92_05725 [Candidatus Limnocylindrales bacterium]|nr:hypothetical protein [Candidatus Limnocylindrales bacterium]
MEILGWLRPARTVPVTRWRSPSRWSPTPSSGMVLLIGLYAFGTGEALIVQGGLGVSPWTVLAQGLSTILPVSIGVATFLVSAVVLLLWIPLRERPGLGTLANAIVIAIALQVGVALVPEPEAWPAQLVLVLLGIAMIGLGSGFYLTTNLGPGPRDGWMTGIHLRTGWPVGRVRLGIELVVLGVGWLLGGTVGVGTVLFAVLIGPAVAQGLAIAGAIGGVPGAEGLAAVEDEFPELDA